MNNEFKKSKSNNETRYTLESMTAGATGSGSIATSVGSVGKVQKRGNILAQEAGKDKVDASKARNFVAKNAKMGGAGAHKDKKKEQKQGAEKHKKPYMEALKQKIEDLKSKLNEAQAEKKTGMVQDRKTGKWYDPKKEFEKKMNSPEVMAQMKRMATKEGKEDKIAQLKKDHETAVHWSKNETSPQKREAARQKAEKIKRHLDTQYKQGVAEAPEDRTSYQVAKILADRGVKYDPAQENELINLIGMILVKELMMTPKQARYLISYDEDFVSDTLGELGNMQNSVSEVAPKGWEGTVKAMKKHKDIDNPYALTNYMKNKGYKSHKKEDAYMESLEDKLNAVKKK